MGHRTKKLTLWTSEPSWSPTSWMLGCSQAMVPHSPAWCEHIVHIMRLQTTARPTYPTLFSSIYNDTIRRPNLVGNQHHDEKHTRREEHSGESLVSRVVRTRSKIRAVSLKRGKPIYAGLLLDNHQLYWSCRAASSDTRRAVHAPTEALPSSTKTGCQLAHTDHSPSWYRDRRIDIFIVPVIARTSRDDLEGLRGRHVCSSVVVWRSVSKSSGLEYDVCCVTDNGQISSFQWTRFLSAVGAPQNGIWKTIIDLSLGATKVRTRPVIFLPVTRTRFKCRSFADGLSLLG
jgi:hypothetical protein